MAIIYATYYVNVSFSYKHCVTKRKKSCRTPFYEMEVGIWRFVLRNAIQTKVSVKRKPFNGFATIENRFHNVSKAV